MMQRRRSETTSSPDMIGSEGDLQVFKDLGGILDLFLRLKEQKRFIQHKFMNFIYFEIDFCVQYERKLLSTDPSGNPSLVLVEALDLGQVSGWGTLHLEALLGDRDAQRPGSVSSF